MKNKTKDLLTTREIANALVLSTQSIRNAANELGIEADDKRKNSFCFTRSHAEQIANHFGKKHIFDLDADLEHDEFESSKSDLRRSIQEKENEIAFLKERIEKLEKLQENQLRVFESQLAEKDKQIESARKEKEGLQKQVDGLIANVSILNIADKKESIQLEAKSDEKKSFWKRLFGME